jgi:GAF domain-containing protein
VRSLAVLPLLQGSELLGVFEVLSSRPNAFGQNELDSLRDLGNRILPLMPPEAEVTVKM